MAATSATMATEVPEQNVNETEWDRECVKCGHKWKDDGILWCPWCEAIEYGTAIPIADADKLTPEELAEIQRKYREFPAEAIIWQAMFGDGKGDPK